MRRGDCPQALGLETEINIWQVVTSSLVIMGYNKGDFILVDAKASVLARPSDVVLVQVYDRQSDNATILLRRFEPPVVVAASPDPDVQLVHVVDNKNVCILGVVTASWRVSKKRNAMCSQF
ncbi:hypothetical protein MNBD_ALPHA07-2176 [hydrothermal vent metagenome]|uniref:Peptidase S24/S26A/S26B/S26C domain-containing protein n=1 Tax=hydrothermal vent metagenome TaxID=652676 RepID=A0A3B0S4E2_9ZZZZ